MALISSVDVWLLQDKGLPTHGPSLTARLQAVDARLATSTERYASEVSPTVSKTGDMRMLMPTRYIYSNNVLMSFSVPSTTILHRHFTRSRNTYHEAHYIRPPCDFCGDQRLQLRSGANQFERPDVEVRGSAVLAAGTDELPAFSVEAPTGSCLKPRDETSSCRC